MIKITNNILDITHNHYQYLMSLENVIGIGMGLKYINNINTLEPCIHVLVEEKVNSKYLTLNNIIPNSYMGIKTDVIRIGKIRPCFTEIVTQKLRPLQGGCGVGLYNDFSHTGTLGCIVFKKKTFGKDYFILSNNHVLAEYNEAPIGTAIIQPSNYLNGNPKTDLIANLSDFVPLKFIEGTNKPINYVDAAIAKISKKTLVSNKIFGGGSVKGVAPVVLNTPAKKVGFTTGLTTGEFLDMGASFKLDYGSHGFIFFQDQIIANLYHDSGDSGSVVLDNNNNVVGLLCAGSFDGKTSFINDIYMIMKELNVEVFTG